MILFEHVSKRYPGGQQGLLDVSFHAEAGEMLFLTGHSGAGKSTLLRLIGLLEHTSQGRILIDNSELAKLKSSQIPYHRRKVGMIFQDHRLLQDRSLFDNVALPLVIAGYGKEETGKRVRAALDQVGLLERENAMPISLSGGQQQRVGIARALVSRPPVVLADEPTGNLDPQLSAEIMKLFERFNQAGITMIIATHDVPLIRRMNKRILVLDQGKLTHDLPAGALKRA